MANKRRKSRNSSVPAAGLLLVSFSIPDGWNPVFFAATLRPLVAAHFGKVLNERPRFGNFFFFLVEPFSSFSEDTIACFRTSNPVYKDILEDVQVDHVPADYDLNVMPPRSSPPVPVVCDPVSDVPPKAVEPSADTLGSSAPPVCPPVVSAASEDCPPSVPPALVDKMRCLRARPHPATRIPLLPAEPRSCLLFKPAAATSLLALSLPTVGKFFSGLHPHPLEIRRIHDGGLAVDFPLGEDLTDLLSVSHIADVPVTVAPPSLRSGSSGVIFGNFSGPEEVTELYSFHAGSNPKLLRVSRLGSSTAYRLDFENSLPDAVRLCFIVFRVKPYFVQPVRCFQCQRFQHVAANCRSPPSCSFCGLQGHSFKVCPNKSPACANCGGPHPASHKLCPHRVFHVRVAQKVASSRCGYRDARVHVAKSFADAVKVPSVSPHPCVHKLSAWVAPAPRAESPPPRPSCDRSVPVSALPELFSRVLSALFPERSFPAQDVSNILSSVFG